MANGASPLEVQVTGRWAPGSNAFFGYLRGEAHQSLTDKTRGGMSSAIPPDSRIGRQASDGDDLDC